jgi:hypothetical protein
VIQLHVLPNSNILTVEAISHDILIYDSTLRFIKKVPGVQRMPSSWEFMEPQLTRNRKVHVCQKEADKLGLQLCLPWFSGVNASSVINTKTFQHKELANMWDVQGQPAFANILAISSDQTVVFGIGQLEHNQTFHLSDASLTGSQLKSKSVLAKTLIPQSRSRYSLLS